MDLLKELRRKLGTAIILITHDLGVVAGAADRVIVLYGGRIAEAGPVRQIYHSPTHPYTWGLLRSVPRVDTGDKKRLVPIDGQPPDLLKPPAGCRFAPRCPYAMGICEKQSPTLDSVGEQHASACWLNHPMAPRVERPTFGKERV